MKNQQAAAEIAEERGIDAAVARSELAVACYSAGRAQ